MIIHWPTEILTPRLLSAVKMPATKKGNPSISGVTQVSASSAGRWKVTAKGFSLHTPEKLRLWRAIEGLANGMAGQFVVGLGEVERVPGGGTLPLVPAVPHSDDSFFSDGSGYHTAAYRATSVARVLAGSTKVQISFGTQPAPMIGQMFSVGLRLYSINRVLEKTATTATVSVWPTVRDEIRAGQSLEFDEPRILCRLASDDEMAVEDLDIARFAFGEITFVEDTGPVLP